MSYPFGEVVFADAGDRSVAAFLYKFLHMPTGKWYIGMHGLKENESPFDGSYWNSSTNQEFLNLLEAEPENFKYEILSYGSMREVFKLENEILTELNAAGDPLSWNKWNGFVYETEELPRLDLIDSLATESYDKNSSLERTTEKVDELFHDLVRLQVRFETEFSHKKISEYRNEMNANNSTKGFIITIVRRDGKKVLVGGNHTLESAKLSRCQNIEVVWIDEDLTMEEMQALGTALNRKTEIARMTTTIGDCANDLVELYHSKKLVDDTFKDRFSTDYIKITGGFKGNDISKVRRLARKTIAEKKSWKKGKKWINWRLGKRVSEKGTLAAAHTDDNVFCVTQSATLRTDRVIEGWIKDADKRKSLGLSPRPNIKILMHYASLKVMNEYNANGNEAIHERVLNSFLRGEGIKNAIITFTNLPCWEDRVS